MEDEFYVEQYYFNGTPFQFGQAVKELVINGDKRHQPRRYIAPEYVRHRPFHVHLLNLERTEIIGRVETKRDKDRTILTVSWPPSLTEQARSSWMQLTADLALLEWQTALMPTPPPTDAVFDEYYRRRSTGDKVTLKEMAEEKGYNPVYLRRVKGDYDRRVASPQHKNKRNKHKM